MSAQTEEQKDIQAIKEDLASVRSHLKTIKERQDNDDLIRVQMVGKIDKILNALTDNDFNGQEGYITRLVKMEMLVKMHELYWKILFSILLGGGGLALLLKLLVLK